MTNETRVSHAEAAEAIKTVRLFLDQLSRDAAAVTETPALVGDMHFTLDVSGLLASGKPYGGHDYQIWIHGDGWAENVSHSDPAKLATKASAMAQMIDEVRGMKSTQAHLEERAKEREATQALAAE